MSRRGKRGQSEPGRVLPDVVPHPRYGTTIVPSGCGATEAEVRGSFYAYRTQTIFPETAIPADLPRQNYTTFPRGYYVDILDTCRGCRRPFVFYAREQQFWYEELGFYIDTGCVYCPLCRRAQHEFRDGLRRYTDSIGRDDLDPGALATLVDDAVMLWRAGVLRDESKLRRLRNLARRRIPDDPATARIDRAIAELEPPPK